MTIVMRTPMVASLLRRRKGYRLVLKHKFSTSTEPAEPFENGWSGIYNLWTRITNRLDHFDRYEKHQVFSPSLGAFNRMLLFIQLQMPIKTEIDAMEFLEGARFAITTELSAINSMDFAQFVNDKSTTSEAASKLRDCSTTAFYGAMISNVRDSFRRRNTMIETEGITVENVHVRAVDYKRVTEEEYQKEVDTMRPPPQKWSSDATIERLQIHVEMGIVQDLKMHMFDTHGKEERLVQQQNLYRCIFESRVTQPDDVDWRIANILRIASTAIERSPAQE